MGLVSQGRFLLGGRNLLGIDWAIMSISCSCHCYSWFLQSEERIQEANGYCEIAQSSILGSSGPQVPGVMKICTPRKYGHPRVPIFT